MCAPAAQPQRTASRSSTPSASATANAEVNASPAPVVSTTFAGNAGTSSPPSSAPRSPSVCTNVADAPATDDDPVLPRRLDEDRRAHRRRRREHRLRTHALALPERNRLVPERVVADGGQEVDLSAEPRGADRLVRALAAVVGAERTADHRLAGRRQPLELDRQ